MKFSALVAGCLLVGLASPVLAADCFGRSELDATGSPGGEHPNFEFKVYFSSMTALVSGNNGVVSNLDCRTSNGARRIEFDVSAHINYECEGSVDDGYAVKMECDGSNTSENEVIGRLVAF